MCWRCRESCYTTYAEASFIFIHVCTGSLKPAILKDQGNCLVCRREPVPLDWPALLLLPPLSELILILSSLVLSSTLPSSLLALSLFPPLPPFFLLFLRLPLFFFFHLHFHFWCFLFCLLYSIFLQYFLLLHLLIFLLKKSGRHLSIYLSNVSLPLSLSSSYPSIYQFLFSSLSHTMAPQLILQNRCGQHKLCPDHVLLFQYRHFYKNSLLTHMLLPLCEFFSIHLYTCVVNKWQAIM